MSYTISEAAEKVGIPATTIRYYDKEGLLPNIKRKNGIRVFEDIDLRLMGLLTCLKDTGMPIKRIREYVELTKKGDASLQERYEIIKAQRRFVHPQFLQTLHPPWNSSSSPHLGQGLTTFLGFVSFVSSNGVLVISLCISLYMSINA